MYEPREDSFLIQRHIKDFCNKNDSVLDMGTGSGILAKEAAKYSENVNACDIDPEVVKKTKAIHSDLFLNIKGKFNLIIFNPPYIPTKKEETRYIDLDGGKNGTEIIEKFLKQAKNFLKKDGKILLLTSSLNKNIEKLFKKYQYKYDLIDQEKLAFEELFLWKLI